MASVLRSYMERSPLQALFLIFVAWKLLIFLITYVSPGIGYDTSSDLLAHREPSGALFEQTPSVMHQPLLKFTRWDGIYYTEIARRGHLFEQEWAFLGFGKTFSLLFAATASVVNQNQNDSASYTMAGVLVSHLAHWFSIVGLYHLSNLLQAHAKGYPPSTAFIAGVLHILSPAGIFLSAPYSESLFAFLNITGYFLLALSISKSSDDALGISLMYKLLGGILFGCATVVRSNGILSGIPFLLDAFETAIDILNPRIDYFTKSRLLLQLQITILAGCCIALGVFWPQLLAYREYCTGNNEDRPWCNAAVPSVYTFVQSHYWNVGFLRYWTLSNLPLFLLAVPCLFLSIRSGVHGTFPSSNQTQQPTFISRLQLRIALPQLVLSVLAITHYHVQVITRLSSGYPYWYIWMASIFGNWKPSGLVVRVMMLYALIQAGLYASFLPPA